MAPAYRATKKPPDGRLEHLVAGAGFEPTASGLRGLSGCYSSVAASLNAPVMCISAASICQMVQLPFGSEGRFDSNSAPLVHYAYKHVVAILLRICPHPPIAAASYCDKGATLLRQRCDKGVDSWVELTSSYRTA